MDIKGNENQLFLDIIYKFDPKVKKMKNKIDVHEQEDLEQEIHLKIYEKISTIRSIQSPDILEVIEKDNFIMPSKNG